MLGENYFSNRCLQLTLVYCTFVHAIVTLTRARSLRFALPKISIRAQKYAMPQEGPLKSEEYLPAREYRSS